MSTKCLSSGRWFAFWPSALRVVVALVGLTAAGETSTNVLTLAEARRQAFVHNWDLLAAKSDVDIAVAQKIVAREFPNPVVAFSTTKINTDGKPQSTAAGNSFWQRNYDTTMAVSQLLEIGGKRASRRASAGAGEAGARARFADARRLLDQGVTQQYIAALLANANVEILRQSAATLRKEAGIAETRLRAGDISQADKSQIEIVADRLELDAATAMTTAVTVRLALEFLMGIDSPQGNWVPGVSLDELAQLSPHDIDSAPGTLRPDLLAAEAARKKADAELRLQKALRVPDPTFFVQYEHQPPDQPHTIGLGVSFPLPLWNHNRGAIDSARSVRAQADLQATKVRAQIATEIASTRAAFADAAERARRYQSEIRPKSEKIRATVSFAFEQGGASLLDLLSAQRTDNEVRLATASALADTATASANLTAALAGAEPAK